MAFLIMLAVAVVMLVVSYLIMPRPKSPKPAAASEMDTPTSDAGKPVGVLFGEMTIKSPNCLGWWDKSMVTYQVNA